MPIALARGRPSLDLLGADDEGDGGGAGGASLPGDQLDAHADASDEGDAGDVGDVASTRRRSRMQQFSRYRRTFVHRMEFLQHKRNPNDYDRAEISALEWVVGEIDRAYPGLKK